MKKYKTIIFDLDDTLIVDRESIKYAFFHILNELNIEYNESFLESWLIHEKEYWRQNDLGLLLIPKEYQESNELRKYFLRANRFVHFFKDLKLDLDAASKLNDYYCDNLGINIVPIKNAKEIISYLSKKYEIVIATNGPKKAAISKLEKASLISYINKIVTSEEIGYPKPTKEFFEFLYKNLINKDLSSVLLVGDNLITDIEFGNKFGLDTCWFNPKNIEETSTKRTMEIDDLILLKKIL